MRVLLFGATGMVGRGVLLECLRAAEVEQVVTLGRTAAGVRDEKVREIVHGDMGDYGGMEDSLRGFDACFYCLGATSSGLGEAAYERLTYGFTLAAAEILSRVHPGITFLYVSGAGTDSTGKGRVMWARVKGRTENALGALPLNAYMFRPGFIEPMDGIRSKTPSYRMLYRLVGPLLPLARRLFPDQILSTRQIGQAMLSVAQSGYAKRVLETSDIRRAAARRARG